MVETIISPKMSLQGWNAKTWFLGNWKTLKELLKVGIPFAISWSTTNNPALIGIITLGGKFIFDLGEYYFKQYTK